MSSVINEKRHSLMTSGCLMALHAVPISPVRFSYISQEGVCQEKQKPTTARARVDDDIILGGCRDMAMQCGFYYGEFAPAQHVDSNIIRHVLTCIVELLCARISLRHESIHQWSSRTLDPVD